MKVKPRFSPGDTKGVIYCVPCQNCDKSYIGETGRTVTVRLIITEHRRYCRNGDMSPSGVSQYTLQDDHGIDREKSTVIARESNYYKRRNSKLKV